MALTKEQKKLLYWQVSTEGMDLLEIPEADDPQNGYEASKRKANTTALPPLSRSLLTRLLTA